MGATAVGLSCHFRKSMAQAWGATSSTPNTETKEKLTKTPNKPPLKKIAPEAKSLTLCLPAEVGVLISSLPEFFSPAALLTTGNYSAPAASEGLCRTHNIGIVMVAVSLS